MTVKTSGLMHVHQVALILACSERHVRNLISRGELEVIKIGKRSRRVKKDSLMQFIEKNQVQPENYFR